MFENVLDGTVESGPRRSAPNPLHLSPGNRTTGVVPVQDPEKGGCCWRRKRPLILSLFAGPSLSLISHLVFSPCFARLSSPASDPRLVPQTVEIISIYLSISGINSCSLILRPAIKVPDANEILFVPDNQWAVHQVADERATFPSCPQRPRTPRRDDARLDRP